MSDNAKSILFENPALLKPLAKYTVQQCFRNTMLEEFHAGTVPDSRSGDFSDVIVKTPYGEIPWWSPRPLDLSRGRQRRCYLISEVRCQQKSVPARQRAGGP